MAETRFRKGDRVKFRFGVGSLEGVVKEDRGPIGIKGRRLYLVEFLLGRYAESTSQIELPAVELERVQDAIATDE